MNNNKRKNNKKSSYNKYKSYLVLLLAFAMSTASISFAANVIYQSDTNKETKSSEELALEIYSNPYYMGTKELEPSAEVVEEPTGVRVAENLKRFGELSSKNSKAIITLEDREDQAITSDTIKYIKHTQGITIVPDSSYIWDLRTSNGKWMLSIFDQNVQHQAKNGFYMVSGKTYYFDSDGYMYIGTMMDERDTVYVFGESGELIYKNPA